MRGATEVSSLHAVQALHFNPRPPCGGRPFLFFSTVLVQILFQSTPPVRGATGSPSTINLILLISIHAPRAGGDAIRGRPGGYSFYFNPRPPCGGRLRAVHGPVRLYGISIHAPRAGGDGMEQMGTGERPNFNPRPPCGGRHSSFDIPFKFWKFQSTPPVRGATLYAVWITMKLGISIHAPRAGGDARRV